jgi:TetR/AcrR family transcriptional regulator
VEAGRAQDPPRPPGKSRHARRSREAILDAGERLFAERGFDGASLGGVAAAAGLSRGTPSYFFGSTERLYTAVLERVFAAREVATSLSFEPVRDWIGGRGGAPVLRRALSQAVERYIAFLLGRPAFVRLIVWEELAGGHRLEEARRESAAVRDAFTALRAVGGSRGLRPFDVPDAELLFISLTFSPLTQRATFLAALGRDLSDDAVRAAHVRFAVGQLMAHGRVDRALACRVAPPAARPLARRDDERLPPEPEGAGFDARRPLSRQALVCGAFAVIGRERGPPAGVCILPPSIEPPRPPHAADRSRAEEMP